MKCCGKQLGGTNVNMAISRRNSGKYPRSKRGKSVKYPKDDKYPRSKGRKGGNILAGRGAKVAIS
jgi:hypothetical protein